MACYHPLRIFYTGRTNPTGGRETIIQMSNLPKELSFDQARKKIKDLKEYQCSGLKLAQNGQIYLTDSERIPCGKCIGCKLDYSRNWATRLMIEARDYGQDNAFLTLTYDQDHYPKDGKINLKHIQNFLKRLRNKYGKGLRVAYSGEYGKETHRAHYHMIVLGIKIDDLRPFNGNLSTSQTVDRIWKMGGVMIGKVTFNSCAYVARYLLKKAGDEETFFHASRKPGLGYEYLQKNGDIFGEGKIYIHTENSNTLKIPTYYRRKLKEEDPYTYEALKTCTDEEAEEIREIENYAGVGDYEKVLAYKEKQVIRSSAKLKRPI